MINLGVIGCGHWGPNHIRVFSSLRKATVRAVSDLDPERLQYVAEQYPTVSLQTDFQAMLANAAIDAVVIATPTDSHYQIVKQALQAGKHVLCEKPLCRHVAEGAELVALAREKQALLMVGHIFLFNAGILKLKELLTAQALGKIFYLSATRTNLGPIRQDVNAVYDLATHDIAICHFLLDSMPVEVSAVGVAFLQQDLHDAAFISLKYPQGIVANLRVSWLDPKKVRQLTIVGDQKMATWDDLAEMGPVILYDKGVIKEPYYSNYGEFQLLAREGDVTVPKLKLQEPLRAQNSYFLECIERGAVGMSDGQMGVEVVRILAAVNASMAAGGQPVTI